MEIANKLSGKFEQYSLPLQYLLADGGFGSGENGPATSVHRLHAFLEAHHIKSFISLPGSYHPLRDGFNYDTERDVYICRNGKFLYNHGIRMEKGFANHYYHAKIKECGVCPFKQECCGNKRRQSLTFSVYRHYHQQMQYGMKRSNAKGKRSAHKMMLMAACAYNLQKLVSYIQHPKNKVQILPVQQLLIFYFILLRVVQQPRPYFKTRCIKQ
jgi:hypothetical protein